MKKMDVNEPLDCVIVGGGPAGVTAGLYLARYRRKVLIYDSFDSRAEKIPLTHNYPGFPDGISGSDLLNKLRQQLSNYKIPIIQESVESLQQIDKEKFLIKTTNDSMYAKNIILATGVKDIEPRLANVYDGIQKGLIRDCPVCDAYEVINKNIAVIGNGKSGLGEALFLRDYTDEITLITLGKEDHWTKKDLKMIQESKIKIISSAIKAIDLSANSTKITFSDQNVNHFDYIYSALGCVKNNKLAKELKLKLKCGFLTVDKDQQTSVKGVFAVGDIVSGLNQLCNQSSRYCSNGSSYSLSEIYSLTE